MSPAAPPFEHLPCASATTSIPRPRVITIPPPAVPHTINRNEARSAPTWEDAPDVHRAVRGAVDLGRVPRLVSAIRRPPEQHVPLARRRPPGGVRRSPAPDAPRHASANQPQARRPVRELRLRPPRHPRPMPRVRTHPGAQPKLTQPHDRARTPTLRAERQEPHGAAPIRPVAASPPRRSAAIATPATPPRSPPPSRRPWTSEPRPNPRASAQRAGSANETTSQRPRNLFRGRCAARERRLPYLVEPCPGV